MKAEREQKIREYILGEIKYGMGLGWRRVTLSAEAEMVHGSQAMDALAVVYLEQHWAEYEAIGIKVTFLRDLEATLVWGF